MGQIAKNPYIAFVLHMDGTPLMPITNPVRVRRLLKSGNARIAKYNPFTIQLTRDSGKEVQPIELCMDAGEQHVGISIKTEKQELVSEQRDLLTDEKERHDDQRKLRRSRRNRKRYRKPKWGCRKRGKRKHKNLKDQEKTRVSANEKWFAPSLMHKKDLHIQIAKRYIEVCPITDVYVEVGQFDTQLLEAIEAGNPIPKGKDYQHGPQYQYNTLREAVFGRDNHTCTCCGSTIGKICTGVDEHGKRNYKPGTVILRMHHLGFKTGDRSNRMSNLTTVCTRCHTAANHKPGGKLYDLDPKLSTFKGAAFMNTVRFAIVDGIKDAGVSVHMTYGAATKTVRRSLNVSKSHVNDAFCMGSFHPKKRAVTMYWKKVRRNNRCLEKFYDAKYIDIRSGEKVYANALGCNRTNRKVPRNNTKNLRHFRGEKLSKGKRSIRRQRYNIRPGDIVLYKGQRRKVIGVHSEGANVLLTNIEQHPLSTVQIPLDKKGNIRPIEKATKVQIMGRSGKWISVKLVSYDLVAGTVKVDYPLDPKTKDVVILRHTGGWEKYQLS